MKDMPTGRLRMRIRAVHTKRELRSRAAAKTAHLNLLKLNDQFMEMMGIEPEQKEKQERLN